MSRQIVVVGAGVIGCAVAYELARAGADVTVVERDTVGAHASHVAAGMLAPYAESTRPGPLLDLGRQSLDYFQELAPALREQTGVDVELRPSGSLRVALSEVDEVLLRRAYRWQMQQGIAVEWLSAAEARACEPALGPYIRGALYCPLEQQVRSRRLVQALAQAAARLGARFLEGTPALGLEMRAGRVSGLRAPSGVLPADEVVLAAGPWTSQLRSLTGLDIPITPKKGQIVRLHATPQPLRHILWAAHRYLVPRADGTVVLGGTEEEVGFDTRSTPAGLAYLLDLLPQLAPALATAEFRQIEVGLRPWSAADGLPYLGRVPGVEGLTLAAGHGRNGILLSAITGRLIARLLLEGRDEIPAACQGARLVGSGKPGSTNGRGSTHAPPASRLLVPSEDGAGDR